jgi:hypothetical protein
LIEQAAKDRFGIEARQTAPDDRAGALDERGVLTVADQRKIFKLHDDCERLQATVHRLPAMNDAPRDRGALHLSLTKVGVEVNPKFPDRGMT